MWLIREFRYAFRSVLRARGFAIAFVVTLGLGIGANAAILSVVEGVFLRPLPNRDEGRIVYINQSAPGIQQDNATFSVPEIQDYRTRSTTMVGFGEFSVMSFTMLGLDEPRIVRAGLVDGQYFDVMGLRPVLGRLIGPEDDGPGKPGVIVLTHRYWTSAFNADPDVLGRQITLSSRPASIIGVLEPAPPYPAETELMSNIVMSPHHLSATMTTDREHRMTDLFGRLAPGATIEGARAELQTLQAAMITSYPEAYDEKARFAVDAVRLRDQITVGARGTLLLLMSTAGLVLLIACANVANLLLARVLRRDRELGVRAALGARTGQLRVILLLECLILSAGGALLGALIAAPSVNVLARYASRYTIRALDVTLDGTVLWTALAIALTAGVVFSFLPRLPAASGTAMVGGLGAGQPRRMRRSQRLLAISQVALSFVLLFGAGLLLRTLFAIRSESPGFETEQVLAVSLPVYYGGRTPDQVLAAYAEIERRVAELPAVRAVGLGSAIPLFQGEDLFDNVAFTIEGRVDDGSGNEPRTTYQSVSGGYFAALGIPLLAGRTFNESDGANADRVVIVGRSVVDRLFPGSPPDVVIGRRFAWTDERMRFGGVSTEWRTVVGVVADTRETGLDRPPGLAVYQAFAQEPFGGRLLVHAAGDPNALIEPVRRIVREVAANQPITLARTLGAIRADVIAPRRLNAILIGGFAAVALAIAAVGIAGVLAYNVSGRMREYGVRMAIGARPATIVRAVLTEGASIAVFGLVLGGAGALALSRVTAGMLYDTPPRDPATFALAAIVLAAATLAAAAVPASRAAGANPVDALRTE